MCISELLLDDFEGVMFQTEDQYGIELCAKELQQLLTTFQAPSIIYAMLNPHAYAAMSLAINCVYPSSCGSTSKLGQSSPSIQNLALLNTA